MSTLGAEVLEKIENLIAQISRNKPKKTKTFHQQMPKNKETLKNADQQYESFLRLYLPKKNKDKQQICHYVNQMSSFKVSNKHSLFLNSVNKKKPLHLRVNEVLQERNQSLMALKSQKKDNHLNQLDSEDMIEQIQQRKKNQKKYTKRQIDIMVNNMRLSQKKRSYRLKLLKLKQCQEHLKNHSGCPQISPSTVQLSKSYRLKKNLSSNLIQRFEQQSFKKCNNQKQYQKRIKQQETPFRPLISQKSRKIVQMSKSVSNLRNGLSNNKMTKSKKILNPLINIYSPHKSMLETSRR